MTSPVVGVLAVQGDVREHLRMLDDLGASGVRVRKPEDLLGVDAVVLPGGESTTIGMLLARNNLVQPLQAALTAGMPALGTCAGMIVLAHDVLDGRPDQIVLDAVDMTVRRNAFGRQVDSFEQTLEVAGLAGPPVRAVFIRAPWAERIGPGVEVLARVPSGPAAGRIVAVRQGRIVATAFHPEVSDDRRFHALLIDMVRDNR